MALKGNIGSIFLSNEELGKKDDDHKPTKVPTIRPQWSAASRVPPRKTLKRFAVVLLLGAFVYLFIKNLPTDVGIRDRRHPVYPPGHEADGPATLGPMPKLRPDPEPPKLKTPAPPETPPELVARGASYSGPIVFPELASTLQAISGTGGSSTANKNVLFAAASLKSAAVLLPMACQMAAELRSYVHFALGGGNEIDLQELRAINGLDDSCQVILHGTAHRLTVSPLFMASFGTDLVIDARPDFPTTSTIARLRNSAARALCKPGRALTSLILEN